ncbi:MAG: 2-succinyl-5-enolpyruvyl-6-hydroxy-3-cyclohexene-1-carboxylic-acid synthase [Paludibacter sp.]|jgi:2-succinyl-5-enolpyruvyl-6-hydroxy-3-cyclohexene-1-carboxylate synthase|nr:2-succinyl-5-enolpyruvyl-6-hydroxy-3-cyclohexene-1-carboxylic-acid synthase [Paludibacter sp.]
MPHFRQGIKNIAEICVHQGIEKVVISPGSRNAPLIFAFTAQPEIECLSIADERSAAYFALGMAQQSGKAVALLCTSGTAVLNYAPAIAEAFYQNIPLIVITADRPAEMIDQADGQTLRQHNIFANYIKSAVELPVETSQEADLQFSDRQVSQAIDTALSYPQGPVQINVPMREPIYTSIPEQHSNPKIIKTLTSQPSLNNDNLKILQEKWTGFQRKMVVFGVFPKNECLNDLANRLAAQPDVVVIAENLSNITGEHIITQPESLFSRINSFENKSDFAPDLVITIGHSVICKQLKIFLRTHQPAEQWQLESSMPYVDTYKSLTTVIPGFATETLDKMTLGKTEGNYSEIFVTEIEKVRLLHSSYINSPLRGLGGQLTDLEVVANLQTQTPSGTTLHLANSTAVRWAQLFPARPDLTYICNRGTSGIDGSLSTAAGYAHSSKQPTVFLSGDVSFIYDSNGLWNNYIGANLKIIVMNNNGGNIFRFIGDKELMKNSLEFFTTPHQVNIKSLVEAYGLDYLSCYNTEDLSTSINSLLNAPKSTVLEVFTNADLNTENYSGYFRNIKTTSNP